MSELPTPRSRRRTAAVMLLSWVLALASGVVNACALETPGTHWHAQGEASAVAPVAQAVGVMAGHLGAVASHDDDRNPAKPSCLKSCDEDSRALPSKGSAGPDPSDPSHAAFPVVSRIVLPASRTQTRRPLGGGPPPHGPPARLRYSRLVL